MRFRHLLLGLVVAAAALLVGLGESELGGFIHSVRAVAAYLAAMGLAAGLTTRPGTRVPALLVYGFLGLTLAVFGSSPALECFTNLANPLGLIGLGAAAGCLLGAPRTPRLSLVFVVLAALALWPSGSLWLNPEHPTGQPRDAEDMTFATSNLLWHHRGGASELLALAREHQVDAIGLLEVSPDFRRETAPQLIAHWPHQAFWPAHPDEWDSQTWGLALLSRRPLLDARIWWPAPGALHSSPVLSARIDTKGGPIQLAVTHCPRPRASLRAMRDRRRVFAGLRHHPWTDRSLLMGDFNATEGSPWLRALLSESQLRDQRQGCGPSPTWPRGSAWTFFGLSLDHQLHGQDLIPIRRTQVPLPGKDHLAVVGTYAVVAEQEPPPRPR